MPEKKVVRKKVGPVVSKEEQALVTELRKKRAEVHKLRKEMDSIEGQIRPLAAKRTAQQKAKRAGLSREEIKALTEAKE